MIFKSIELHNFRQYKDVKLEFDNRINVIEAGNGIGKSTLMAALIFTLYGSKEVENSGFLEEVSESNPLINVDCIDPHTKKLIRDDMVVRSVLTILSDNGKEYVITRTYSPAYLNDEVKVGYKNEATNYLQEDTTIEELAGLVPKEFIPLLFFNGERIKAIEDSFSSNSEGFKEEIEKILKIDDYNNAKNLINRCTTRLSKDAHIHNPKIESLTDDVNKLTTLVNNTSAKIESSTILLDDCVEDRFKTEEMLKTFEETKEAYEQIQFLTSEINSLDEKCIKSKMKAREQILLNYPNLIKINIFEDIYSLESESEDNYKIIGIEQNAIDAIVENKICICGTELSEEQIFRLKELRKSLPPESFQTILSYSLNNKDDEKKKLHSYIKDYSDAAAKDDDKMIELKNKRQELKSHIRTENYDEEITRLTKKHEDLSEIIRKCEIEVFAAERDLEKYSNMLKKKESELNKELEKKEMKNIESESMQLLRKASDRLVIAIKDRRDNLKSKLTERVNEYANQFLYDEIDIELDARLKPTKFKLRNGAESLSTGQKVTVSLAYLFALMETSKMEEDFGHTVALTEEYPIILDGVTATLDLEHSKRLINYLNTNSGQSIIFANTKEVLQFIEVFKDDCKKIKLNKYANSNEIIVEV